MSRMALAATSLVAAIPAGILAALAIIALLGHAGDMKPLVLGVVGGMTALGVLIALSPVIILVGKRKTTATVKAASEAKSEPVPSGVSGAQTAEIVADELSEPAGEQVEDTESMTSSDEVAATDDFQFEEDAFLGDELAESEPEPEPEPKKKKKKKR